DVAIEYDPDILQAAILHDTIEDTETTQAELLMKFGKTVTDYVVEMTDDKSLPKAERKRLQIVNAPHKSKGAKLIKYCDKICNITDVMNNPPTHWSLERRKEYYDWAEQVVNALGREELKLDWYFEKRIREAREKLGME
ncbi:MAG: HD domain-containing protein, partial [Ignavibacteria bacterium]